MIYGPYHTTVGLFALLASLDYSEMWMIFRQALGQKTTEEILRVICIQISIYFLHCSTLRN